MYGAMQTQNNAIHQLNLLGFNDRLLDANVDVKKERSMPPTAPNTLQRQEQLMTWKCAGDRFFFFEWTCNDMIIARALDERNDTLEQLQKQKQIRIEDLKCDIEDIAIGRQKEVFN